MGLRVPVWARQSSSHTASAGTGRRKLDPLMRNLAWQPVLFGLQQDWSPQQLCDRLKDGALPAWVVPAGLTLNPAVTPSPVAQSVV
jgi:hypothetical protein